MTRARLSANPRHEGVAFRLPLPADADLPISPPGPGVRRRFAPRGLPLWASPRSRSGGIACCASSGRRRRWTTSANETKRGHTTRAPRSSRVRSPERFTLAPPRPLAGPCPCGRGGAASGAYVSGSRPKPQPLEGAGLLLSKERAPAEGTESRNHVLVRAHGRAPARHPRAPLCHRRARVDVGGPPPSGRP